MPKTSGEWNMSGYASRAIKLYYELCSYLGSTCTNRYDSSWGNLDGMDRLPEHLLEWLRSDLEDLPYVFEDEDFTKAVKSIVALAKDKIEMKERLQELEDS